MLRNFALLTCLSVAFAQTLNCKSDRVCKAKGDTEAVCIDGICRCSEGYVRPREFNGAISYMPCLQQNYHPYQDLLDFQVAVLFTAGKSSTLTPELRKGINDIMNTHFERTMSLDFTNDLAVVATNSILVSEIHLLSETNLAKAFETLVASNPDTLGQSQISVVFSLDTVDCDSKIEGQEYAISAFGICLVTKCQSEDYETLPQNGVCIEESDSDLSAAEIAGIVIGSTLCCCILLVIVVFFCFRSKKSKDNSNTSIATESSSSMEEKRDLEDPQPQEAEESKEAGPQEAQKEEADDDKKAEEVTQADHHPDGLDAQKEAKPTEENEGDMELHVPYA